MAEASLPVPRQPIVVSFGDMERLASAIAKSGLFGMKTPEQALALMAIAQAEGRHPALAARDYSIIQGRPAKNAEAMQRDFLESGGRIEWHELTDTAAEATFSHPAGGSARIRWDMGRAKTAGLNTKQNWRQYPRQMLRSRVVSEGVRTVCPMATSGMYVPEEMADFEPRDITPARPTLVAPQNSGAGVATQAAASVYHGNMIEAPHDPDTGELLPPHEIPEASTPITRGAILIAAIKTATAQIEIDQWEEQNIGWLDTLGPKAKASVERAFSAQRARIGVEPEPEPELLGADEAGDALHA